MSAIFIRHLTQGDLKELKIQQLLPRHHSKLEFRSPREISPEAKEEDQDISTPACLELTGQLNGEEDNSAPKNRKGTRKKMKRSRVGSAAARQGPDRPFEKWRNLLAFWTLGVINNTTYVIMIAGAKQIASGGVALVYLADIAPTFLIKLTAPYWFPYVSLESRVRAAAVLMTLSLITVALGKTLGVQLAGVAMCAVQSGIGEPSILGLTASYHGPSTITAWSSGTGFAGVMGYAWIVVLHTLLGLSFQTTLLLALVLPGLWCLTFFALLERPLDTYKVMIEVNAELEDAGSDEDEYEDDEEFSYTDPRINGRRDSERAYRFHSDSTSVARSMSVREKLRLTFSLWPYIVPLVTVYFAEYAMQSGVWPAIGFPVTDEVARAQFYGYANWAYQAGVFLSRSSGLLIPPSMALLWIMPTLQCGLLVFFIVDGITHFWYDWSLLGLCFVVGLLGGAVYVSGFSLISRNAKEEHKAQSLVTASIADTLGIICSDVSGLIIQGCLYRANSIPGATFSCRRKNT